MSQSKFSSTFGIPLATLQGWEQGKRKIDTTTASYLRTIMKFPNEVQQALSE
jgi:putative transcriptional regulator